MVARDSVIVVTEEGRRLVTPELKYDQALNQISSDSAFVLTEPGRSVAGRWIPLRSQHAERQDPEDEERNDGRGNNSGTVRQKTSSRSS